MIGVDQDGKLNLLHLLLSVPVGLYSTDRRLFTCLGKLLYKGLSPEVELHTEAFAAQRSVRAIPEDDHVIHLNGFTPSVC